MRLTSCWMIGIFAGVLGMPLEKTFSQCSPQSGAGPQASFFRTGQAPAGSFDPSWKVAQDSITGEFKPATVMQGLPSLYYHAPLWISFSASGEHSRDRFFFFMINVDLPCFNLCGKSFNDNNAYCLNLDLYADNSIYEIYINGKPQSGNLGNIIPLANPFNPTGHTPGDKTTVSLCKDWKAGPNILIIQIASSATVAGLLVEPTFVPIPPPDADTISKIICDGEAVSFANQTLTKSGYYFHSFPRASGCDSNVVLRLTVNPKPNTIIDTSICEGDNYEGYTAAGTFVDFYKAANGCDSVRQLHLTVRKKPKPVMPANVGICEGDSLLLAAGEFDTYLWQNGSTANHFIIRAQGTYSVTVGNSCGTAFAETHVGKGICSSYFPNAFTPNSDMHDDYFKILTDLKFQQFHLIVFNRWGQKVFESNDPLKGWDGRLNGREQPSGVYVWKCVFTRSNVSTQSKGTVFLIR